MRSLGKILSMGAALIAALGIALAFYLFRPFLELPLPAKVTCLDPSAGRFDPLPEPREVYGLGLSYAGHIAESPGLYEPGAPPPGLSQGSACRESFRGNPGTGSADGSPDRVEDRSRERRRVSRTGSRRFRCFSTTRSKWDWWSSTDSR